MGKTDCGDGYGSTPRQFRRRGNELSFIGPSATEEIACAYFHFSFSNLLSPDKKSTLSEAFRIMILHLTYHGVTLLGDISHSHLCADSVGNLKEVVQGFLDHDNSTIFIRRVFLT